jgi:hypothetical protein
MEPDDPAAQSADESGPAKAPPSRDEICRMIESAATLEALPVEFFARLIWQESRFDPQAVSPVGAQGIAQFMPKTANGRGLADPFVPLPALRESAQYLRELREQFGNLGLAAAAYNGGPRRVQEWLAKKGPLPDETQHYVVMVTGHGAETWAGSEPPAPEESEPFDCERTPRLMARRSRQVQHARARLLMKKPAETPLAQAPAQASSQQRRERDAERAAWGVQLAGNWSEQKALASYQQMQKKFGKILRNRRPMIVKSRVAGRGSAASHRIRIALNSRENAEKLCAQLKAAGGSCVVLRDPDTRGT